MAIFTRLILLALLTGLAARGVAESPAAGPLSPGAADADTVSEEIFRKITYGTASLEEVRRLLTNTDIGGLTNTMHALYSMRWHRGVINLLDDIWALHTAKYPELAWKQLQSTPVRIALASTINRIQIFDTAAYLEYIRDHKNDDHEFHRAQVVISLGLNGDPADVEYLAEMAEGDNVYVSQSAITALGLMANQHAKDTLIRMVSRHTDNNRGRVIREVLKKSYHWSP